MVTQRASNLDLKVVIIEIVHPMGHAPLLVKMKRDRVEMRVGGCAENVI